MSRKMSKREVEKLAGEEARRQIQLDKKFAGGYTHVAEIYGDSETRGLTRWARTCVLTQG